MEAKGRSHDRLLSVILVEIFIVIAETTSTLFFVCVSEALYRNAYHDVSLLIDTRGVGCITIG